MKIERLRKDHKKEILIGGLVILLVISTVMLVTTRAKFRLTQTVKLAEGTVTYKTPDLNIIAMYKETDSGYQAISSLDELAGETYEINTTKSVCGTYEEGKTKIEGTSITTKDNSISIEYKNNLIYVGGISKKGTKCYVWFDVKELTLQETMIAQAKDTTPDFSKVETTKAGIFKAPEGSSTSYYYRGQADNFVQFAGFWWRIIRMNGNGSIRLIYNGKIDEANPTTVPTGSDTQIGTGVFNDNAEFNNMYVGYMYTSGEVHGTSKASTIKQTLEDIWYTSNINKSGIKEHIDTDAGFCGDRTFTEGTGVGNDDTFFSASVRLIDDNAPTYNCADSRDLYTVGTSGGYTASTQGNKLLKYPVGLITADEVAYAGGVIAKSNANFYLKTGENYWTMTPWEGGIRYNNLAIVGSSSSIWHSNVYNQITNGIRPVINLKSDTVFTTTGTGAKGSSTNPWIVVQ